jgi:hypothetical protein
MMRKEDIEILLFDLSSAHYRFADSKQHDDLAKICELRRSILGAYSAALDAAQPPEKSLGQILYEGSFTVGIPGLWSDIGGATQQRYEKAAQAVADHIQSKEK